MTDQTLPVCRLCKCVAADYKNPGEDVKHHCANDHCTLHMVLMTPEQWTALMGADRDAARYRWLREQHWSKSRVVAVIDPKTSVRPGQYCPSLDLLDLEIDTAMNKGEG